MLKNENKNEQKQQNNTDSEQPSEQKKFFKEFKGWLKVIVISFILAFLVTSVVKPTLVVGESMNDTLQDKDYLLINRLAYIGDSKPEYKDIVVFKTDLEDERILIKRVIGVEGDAVRVENGLVVINDKVLLEKYPKTKETIGSVDLVVPKGKVFVLGDNRDHSLDSRFEEIGLVDESQIIGKVFMRVFPFEKINNELNVAN